MPLSDVTGHMKGGAVGVLLAAPFSDVTKRMQGGASTAPTPALGCSKQHPYIMFECRRRVYYSNSHVTKATLLSISMSQQ